MGSRIIGCSGYLPPKVVTNKDLEKTIDTSHEWIVSRTGINQRHIAEQDQYTSHMAYKAAEAAILDSGINSDEIDLLIVCTNTPDNSFPGVANKIQSQLGLRNIPSFDLQAICSGFIYGMHVADSMMLSGKYRTVLLVCADKMSSLLDWSDRSTCVLFGDGAGAVILQKDKDVDSGIIDSHLYSDGSMYDILHTNGGVSMSQTSGNIAMKGPELFKKAVEKMSESVEIILDAHDLNVSDVDYIIPHQANIRIINSVANRLGISTDKFVITIEKHANCSAASIPLALADLRSTTNIESGKLILFTAFGAGTSWGSVLVKW